MRIAFFGSGAFGLPTLRMLASAHELIGIVTQPDKPAGRGGRSTPTPIGEAAGDSLSSVEILKPVDVNAPPAIDTIRAWHADAFIVIAFGQKLSPAVLTDAAGRERFAINLHASLLPRWRGAAPINAAILAGDAETGNSVITLAQRMDAGLILGQSRRPIEPRITAGELHDLLAADGPALVSTVLEAHERGTLRPQVQDAALVTKAGKLQKSDGWIDFSNAEACRRRVHGLTPWPGVTVRFRGEPLKVLRVESRPISAATDLSGAILDARVGDIACADGSILRVLEVQPANKRQMPWADFANGHRVAAGERFDSPADPAIKGAAC